MSHVIPLKKINKEIKKTTLRWNFPQVLKVELEIDRSKGFYRIRSIFGAAFDATSPPFLSALVLLRSIGNVLVLRKPIR